MNYALQGQASIGNLCTNPDVLYRLREKESRLQGELIKTQEAIKALESNPDLVKVLDAIQGGLY